MLFAFPVCFKLHKNNKYWPTLMGTHCTKAICNNNNIIKGEKRAGEKHS